MTFLNSLAYSFPVCCHCYLLNYGFRSTIPYEPVKVDSDSDSDSDSDDDQHILSDSGLVVGDTALEMMSSKLHVSTESDGEYLNDGNLDSDFERMMRGDEEEFRDLGSLLHESADMVKV